MEPDDIDETPDAEVSAEEWSALVKRHGEKIRALEICGRRWVLRGPSRPEWIECKAAKASSDVTTAVMATTMLARRCLLPYAPSGDVKGEREAFDTMCNEYPAAGDLFAMAVEAMALGPLPVRGVTARPPSPPPAATPTPPPTP